MTPLLLALFLAADLHHLGVAGDPEWDEFRAQPPEGPRFEYHFELPAHPPKPVPILLRQRDVKLNWLVQINGKTFTNLFLSEDDLVNLWNVPADFFKPGSNTLSIIPPKGRDDIEVGNPSIGQSPQSLVTVSVRENGTPIPSRLTVVDSNGSLFPAGVLGQQIAVRPGVVYLGAGSASLKLQPGLYTFYAGRGFEYSVATQTVRLTAGAPATLDFSLRREVNTRGFVSCDTHVHTFTHSGHGDATDAERAITLAGEGIELPIATDHNVIVAPQAGPMDRYFTSVPGVEVTTEHGHFNIFPVAANARAPNFRLNDWPDLMKELRATPGVQVVILNHPRNIHNNFQPFAAANFNAETGQNLRGPEFTFDAVEVLNSSALQSDWMLSFKDWMALLNYGYRTAAVGSSDCHDVSRYIVGQGRTYIECDDADVAKIDIAKACQNLRAGRALVSMGLLVEMKERGRAEFEVTVQGPGWTAADQVQIFANGELIRDEKFEPNFRPGVKKQFSFKISNRPKDYYLVALASGPPVTAPFWRIPKPYQPTSTTWQPRVIAATNPIWIDADGDGSFTPLRLQK